VIEVILVLVRVATSAWHGLGRQAVIAQVSGGWRSDLGIGTATTRSSHTWINAGHAKAIRARKGRRKTVAVTVLRRGRWLAMRRLLSVAEIGREAVNLFFAAARLQIYEFHFGFKASALFFQIFVLKLLLFELQAASAGHTRPSSVVECNNVTRTTLCVGWWNWMR
jgi:hypothetical protein